MKKIYILLFSLLQLNSYGQDYEGYEIRAIAKDGAFVDTLFIRPFTDSTFRIVAGVFVFQGLIKSQLYSPGFTITLTDTTTNDFSILKHGFVPKGTNVGDFLKDDGTWAVPPSGSGTVTEFIYIDGNGFDGAVINETSTPALLLDLQADNNFVTDAEKAVIGNTSGTNTGNQDLSGLVSTSVTVNGHALTSNVTVTASDLSLENVNNTSDANKPISTAQQTALDLKSNLISPSFTTPVLGTPTTGTLDNCTSNTETVNNNSTQLATTAYVDSKDMVAIATAGTTVSTTFVDLTGMSITLVAGTYLFDTWIYGQAGTGTAGAQFCMNYTGTTTSYEANQSGQLSTTTLGATARVTAVNTASTTLFTTSAAEGFLHISGKIVVSNGGNLVARGLKVTSQTLTWRGSSWMRVRRIS